MGKPNYIIPEVGQYYRGRYHQKVIKVLEVHDNKEPSSRNTILAELQVPGGGGKQWEVQWDTLKRSYKLLDEHEVTNDGSLSFGASIQ